MSGHKIIEGLRQAVAGNFARVTIEGQTWVRVDDANPDDPDIEAAAMAFANHVAERGGTISDGDRRLLEAMRPALEAAGLPRLRAENERLRAMMSPECDIIAQLETEMAQVRADAERLAAEVKTVRNTAL